jgi:NADH:ubiquinone oxidoreductase subunit 6 (subunit J)
MSVATIHWHSFFFLLMALVACAMSIAVVVTSNIVRMAFYLVISLGAVAGLFFLAGADFLGAMQLMIYVGGTLVLLAFGVMLTARGPFISMRTGGGQWILAAIVGGSLLAVLLQVALSVKAWSGRSLAEHPPAIAAPPTAEPIGLALLGVRSDQLEQKNSPLRGGMSGYLLVFEIISVHLVVVLVGAAYLARARKRPGQQRAPARAPLDVEPPLPVGE